MKLSIIIPYYNGKKYTDELLDCLAPQMTGEVEVIVIDDGSTTPFKTDYRWVKVKRKRNGGASSARNAGLDMCQGDYVAFIDSDDLVAETYIKTIINKIDEEKFDYCYMSWKTMPGSWDCDVKLKSIEDKFPPFNLCVWNRIYKRDMIGDVRFNTKKKIAEDAEFIRKVHEKGKKKAFISEYMYFYRTGSENSLSKQFAEGRLDMERVVYHIHHVTKDMTQLIKEFKDTDKYAEVILLTNQNDMPELEDYAMVMKPCKIKGTELRGEPTPLFEKIIRPEETQVVIYTAVTGVIGGIETFTFNFCQIMREYYDIIVLYDEMHREQLTRLQKIVDVRKNDKGKMISCDTVIINRITDNVPSNIKYKQKIQMVHACKMVPSWKVPKADAIIPVSEAVVKSFPEMEEHTVINNLVCHEKTERALLLVSATRTKTFEKGQKRMVLLGRLLEKKKIPYIWLCFTDSQISMATKHMVKMDPTLDILSYIKAADYLVQLSDAEGFCYSIVEALEVGTAVITTPLDVLPEIGFQDMINGYMVPFNITEDLDVEMFKSIPKFEYEYDNESRIKQWRKILGNKKPKHKYKPDKMATCRIIRDYFDTVFGRSMVAGEVVNMTMARANTVKNAGYCEVEL